VIFGQLDPSMLQGQHALELLLPTNSGGTRDVLWWQTPLTYPSSLQGTGGLNIGLLLSLAAGLLATISPCLVQLTAFYLPTLAGVSLGSATAVAAIERRRILGTALVFVLGFTIPYTVGGALLGGMGQIVAASGWLNPTGPIAEGAGVVMIGMALLVAHQARAPLVCKLPMPMAARSGVRSRLLTTFLSGFAIATGCVACFGGAIFGVILVYAGLLGSWSMGALAMFFFSVGLAVPFMLAAMSLSWVLPTVHRLQRFTPAIALAMSVVMLFFGVSMATGNYHLVSGWLFQHLPLG
jgi:cytochrome c-type biogenesis protein